MSHSRQTAQASMQLGARRLTLLEGLTCITQGGGGGGGTHHRDFRNRKSTLQLYAELSYMG